MGNIIMQDIVSIREITTQDKYTRQDTNSEGYRDDKATSTSLWVDVNEKGEISKVAFCSPVLTNSNEFIC
jgi:hypothetical protein